MNEGSFAMDEFIGNENKEAAETAVSEEIGEMVAENLDVQKAVVEAFAVEKIELEGKIKKLSADLVKAENEKKALEEENGKIKAGLDDEIKNARGKFQEKEKYLLDKINELEKTVSLLEKEIKKFESGQSNTISLLDKNPEVEERFEGEMRDFTLEAIQEAFKKAEEEKRERKAKMLESVIVQNEQNGNLEKKRREITDAFTSNGNILSGAMIEYLKKEGISHRDKDEYLLPTEIIKRNF